MGNPIRGAKLVGALTLLAAMAMPTEPLAGQKSTTRGLNLGLHLQAASLSVEDEEGDGGGGLGLRVGYGINRIFTLYLEADGVSVDSESADVFQGTWSLGHVDLGARFHFANALRSWVPYLEVAVGARAASVDDVEADGQDLGDISFSGGAFSFGGGIYAYFSQTLALEVGVKFSSGEFDEVDLGPISLNDLDIDANSTRFKVGLLWWP